MLQIFQVTLQGWRTSKRGTEKTYVMLSVQDQKDLVFMKLFLEAGQIVPKIDECYLLSRLLKLFGVLRLNMLKEKSSSTCTEPNRCSRPVLAHNAASHD